MLIKGFHSIVLMALVDADYKFIFVDIGCQGRLRDGGVFKNTHLYEILNSGLNLPNDRPLPDLHVNNNDANDSFLDGERIQKDVPYVIIADDAFPLGRRIMKPYAQKDLTDGKRICNYRFSRARRTSENAYTFIHLSPENAGLLTMSCCLLHNLLHVKSPNSYTPINFVDEVQFNGHIVDGEWRNRDQSPFVCELQPSTSRNPPLVADEVRNIFKEYFQTRGQVPWQYGHTHIYIYIYI